MNVHQLSIAYVREQDRILARVNTKEGRELKFWLTRRLTLGLTPLMDRVVTEHVGRNGSLAVSHLASMDDLAKKAVTEFQRSHTLKSADFATPYKTSETSVPLFDHPLLLTEVKIAAAGNGQLRLSCFEKLAGHAGNRSFQMTLSEQLIHAFVHLLERALTQSQWREVAAGGAEAVGGAREPVTGPDNPGYLN